MHKRCICLLSLVWYVSSSISNEVSPISCIYAGLSLEKSEYFVSEGDGFVEVCGKLYGRRGLTRAFQLYTQRYNYFTRGILLSNCFFWILHSEEVQLPYLNGLASACLSVGKIKQIT